MYVLEQKLVSVCSVTNRLLTSLLIHVPNPVWCIFKVFRRLPLLFTLVNMVKDLQGGL
jgi:hypothetical protein